MLNQLIESKNHHEETARTNRFLVGTLGILVAVLVSGWTYSLFAKNFGMGTGDFELSRTVLPVAVTEDAPPPKPEMKVETTQAAASNKIVLRDLYDDISAAKNLPKDTRGEKEVVSANKFNLKDVERGDFNQIPENMGRNTGTVNQQGCGLCRSTDENTSDKEDEKAPEVVKPTPKPSVEPKRTTPVSLGVINGKATYLAKPPYPQAARQMGVSGAVNVQVLIDENGNVVSATAVSGHPLLRNGAVNAARQSRFTPTFLSKQPVKVTGVIVYQFQP